MRSLAHGALARLEHMRRRIEVGLADAEIDDRLALALELEGPVENGEGAFLFDARDGGIGDRASRRLLEH